MMAMTTNSSIKVKADPSEEMRRSPALASVFVNGLEVANTAR